MPTINQLVVYDKALATPYDLEEARRLGKGKGFVFYEIDFAKPDYWLDKLLLKIKRITKCSGKKPNLVSACFNYSQELELMKVRMWVRNYFTNFLDLPNLTIMNKPMFENYYIEGLKEVVVSRGMDELDLIYVTTGASTVAKNTDVHIIGLPKMKTHQSTRYLHSRLLFGDIPLINADEDKRYYLTGMSIRDIIVRGGKAGVNGVNIKILADLKYEIHPVMYQQAKILDITNFKIKQAWEEFEGLKIDEERKLIIPAMCTMAIKKIIEFPVPMDLKQNE